MHPPGEGGHANRSSLLSAISLEKGQIQGDNCIGIQTFCPVKGVDEIMKTYSDFQVHAEELDKYSR